MPSFLVHSIAGREVIKKLNLSTDQENKFFIANLLPDTRQIERDPNWDEVELRRNIQKEKKITHFRTNDKGILEYPNLDLFLDHYGELITNDIIVFGYFFHLYTDYYYFKEFLPRIITFLDKDYNITNKKTDNAYIKINKDGKIISKLDFWSKVNPDGLYQDYSRTNKYLITKYNFKYNYDIYKEYLKDISNFPLKIKEIKFEKIFDLLEELNIFYNDSKNSKLEEFRVFTKEDIDNLVNEIIANFLEEYDFLLRGYK